MNRKRIVIVIRDTRVEVYVDGELGYVFFNPVMVRDGDTWRICVPGLDDVNCYEFTNATLLR